MANFWRRFGIILDGITAAVRAFLRVLKSGSSRSTRLLAPASQPPSELPASYGRPKVTLMAVNPYLVHVYWDVDTSRLPAGTKSAVLRFHDVTETAPAPGFEVDIDLRAPNWYVHLWSPAKSYYADLAVKTDRGEFLSLAISNRVETPRAWPAAETPDAPVVPSVLPPSIAQPAAASPSMHSGPLPAARPSGSSADEVLRQKLAAISALRSSQPRPALAMAASASGEVSISRTKTPAAIPADLTALADSQFSPGLPSSPKRDPQVAS